MPLLPILNEPTIQAVVAQKWLPQQDLFALNALAQRYNHCFSASRKKLIQYLDNESKQTVTTATEHQQWAGLSSQRLAIFATEVLPALPTWMREIEWQQWLLKQIKNKQAFQVYQDFLTACHSAFENLSTQLLNHIMYRLQSNIQKGDWFNDNFSWQLPGPDPASAMMPGQIFSKLHFLVMCYGDRVMRHTLESFPWFSASNIPLLTLEMTPTQAQFILKSHTTQIPKKKPYFSTLYSGENLRYEFYRSDPSFWVKVQNILQQSLPVSLHKIEISEKTMTCLTDLKNNLLSRFRQAATQRQQLWWYQSKTKHFIDDFLQAVRASLIALLQRKAQCLNDMLEHLRQYCDQNPSVILLPTHPWRIHIEQWMASIKQDVQMIKDLHLQDESHSAYVVAIKPLGDLMTRLNNQTRLLSLFEQDRSQKSVEENIEQHLQQQLNGLQQGDAAAARLSTEDIETLYAQILVRMPAHASTDEQSRTLVYYEKILQAILHRYVTAWADVSEKQSAISQHANQCRGQLLELLARRGRLNSLFQWVQSQDASFPSAVEFFQLRASSCTDFVCQCKKIKGVLQRFQEDDQRQAQTDAKPSVMIEFKRPIPTATPAQAARKMGTFAIEAPAKNEEEPSAVRVAHEASICV